MHINNIRTGIIFCNTRGNQIDNAYLLKFYRDILKSLNFNTNATLHNLRHQFTNTTYNLMLTKGYDENVILAYLHRYLGHNSIKETEHYLQFTIDKKKKIIEANNSLSEYLFKDVMTNE
nr:tyrosine-type recombinase/integrase [Thomasclavelia saccharogumia]